LETTKSPICQKKKKKEYLMKQVKFWLSQAVMEQPNGSDGYQVPTVGILVAKDGSASAHATIRGVPYTSTERTLGVATENAGNWSFFFSKNLIVVLNLSELR
jgi:hypothetical protein